MEKRFAGWLCGITVFLILLSVHCTTAEGAYSPAGDFEYEIRNNEVYITSYIGSDAVVSVPERIDGCPVVSVRLSKWPDSDDPFIYYTVKKVILPSTVRILPDYAFHSFYNLEEIEGLESVAEVGYQFAYSCPVRNLRFSGALTSVHKDALYALVLDLLVIPDNLPNYEFLFEIFAIKECELIVSGGAPTLCVYNDALYTPDRKTLLLPFTTGSGCSVQGLHYSIAYGTTAIGFHALNNLFDTEVVIPESVTEIHPLAINFGGTCVIGVYPDSEGLRYVLQKNEEGDVYIDYFMVGQEEDIYEIQSGIINTVINSGMDDWEIALALHDWFVDNVSYDYDMENYSALLTLKNRQGTCQGIAEAYKSLLDLCGVQSAYAGNESHIMNAVRINGQWMFVDCTWDLDDSGYGDALSHLFFGFNANMKLYCYGNEGEADYSLRDAGTTRYHYWMQNGLLNDTIDACTEDALQRIGSGLEEFQIGIDSNTYDIPQISVFSAEGDCRGITTRDAVGYLIAPVIQERLRNETGFETITCCYAGDGKILIEEVPGHIYDFAYVIRQNTCIIVGYLGNESDIVIPESIDGYPVKRIDNSAFEGDAVIASITIPEGVVSIGRYAFFNCVNLKSVSLPASISSIGDSAFSMSGIRELVIPEGLTELGEAFISCEELRMVSIPSTMTEISDNAFSGCRRLSRVMIPESVRRIGAYAFAGCWKLEQISFPTQVDFIGSGVFSHCKSLTEVSLPDGIENISSNMFSECSKLTGVTIPSSVSYIGYMAFSACNGLTEFTVPEQVTGLGQGVFINCRNLVNVSLPESLSSLGASAFAGCSRLEHVNIPAGLTAISDSVFSYCYRLSNVVIPSNITGIGSRAFVGCSGLQYLSVPESVTFIAGDAFSEWDTTICVRCTSYAYDWACENDYPCIADHAWSDIVYTWSVDNTGVTAARVCGHDESHIETERAGVQVIASAAPSQTEAGEWTLQSDPFTNTAFSVQNRTVTIPALSELSVLILPDSLSVIEEGAFENLPCQAVFVPEGCTDIGSGAFANCGQLLYVQITCETAIAPDAFDGCVSVIVDRAGE